MSKKSKLSWYDRLSQHNTLLWCSGHTYLDEVDKLDDVDIDDDVDTELEVETLKGMKRYYVRKIQKASYIKTFLIQKPDIIKGNNSVTIANECNM